MAAPDLSKPERLLWEAYPRGAWVDLRDRDLPAGDVMAWGPDRVIRAEVIRSLLLGAPQTEPGFVPGVRLRGARISGRLDLMGASVPCPLVCEYCHFDDEIRFVESSTRTVRIVDSSFPAFNGTRMRVDGILNLWTCAVAGMIRLDQAKVSGQVCLRGATIGEGANAVAVSADGLSVDGDVECVGLAARGALSMQGSQISGSIDLTDARISCPGTRALMIGNASIGGRLIGRGLRVEGEMLLHDTHIAVRVELAGARLHNPAGAALSAGGLVVNGGIFCVGGFTARGEIKMIGAQLGANLAFGKATLTNPGKVALNLDRATVGDFDGSDLSCSGQIRLIGARVASGLSLTRANLDGSAGQPVLLADGAAIDGTLLLAQLHAQGEEGRLDSLIGRPGPPSVARSPRTPSRSSPDHLAVRHLG